MRRLIAIIFFLNLGFTCVFAGDKTLSFFKDTIYTIQVGCYKKLEDIHPELKNKYEEVLGFRFSELDGELVPDAMAYRNFGDSYIFYVTHELISGKDTVRFPVYKLFHGSFVNVDSMTAFMETSEDFNRYFSDGIPVKGFKYIPERKGEVRRFKFVAIEQKAIDSFLKGAVGRMEKVLFFDLFSSMGMHTPTLFDDNGMPKIDKYGKPINHSIPLVVVWLIVGATFFTLFFGFINIKGLRHAIGLVSGKHDDKSQKGEVSHFQALTTALSATVGLGNIAGVAIAISIGGPGATFWMIVAGLLGMSSKFVECTLGVKYRRISKDGEVSGGPMYYLSRGLKRKGKFFKHLGMTLAGLFAVLCVGGSLGGGNMFQANQAFAQFESRFPGLEGQGVWFGLILAVLVGIVIIGGIQKIAKVTEKIVPFMAVLYVSVALVIIFMNITKIGDVFSIIFNGAFAPDALKGGVIGVLILGFKRAAFSNEAGVGSASIAHSAVKTNEPVTEGYVSLLEPFIDTIVICTMTALVIIFTGVYENPYGLGGAPLTSVAFESVFPWFPWLLMIAILLFAFSTMISWSYYGLKAWTYLFGEKKWVSLSYKAMFLIFVIIGSASNLNSVINFSDMMILAMAFPNLIGAIILAPEVKRDLKKYRRKLKNKKLLGRSSG